MSVARAGTAFWADEMIADYLAMLRRFERNVRLYLVAGGVLGFTTAGGVFAVLMNLYVLRLGFDIQFVGLLNFCGAFSFAFCSFLAGTIGRRWGPRRSMVLGILFIAVGNATLPAAELVAEAWRAEFLLVTRLPRAFGFALFHVNANPFLMEATGPSERTHVFSVQAAFWSLAAFCGSLFGGLMPGFFAELTGRGTSDPEPYRYALVVATLMLLPAAAVMARARETGAVQSAEVKSGDGDRPTVLIAVIAIAAFFLFSGATGVQVFFNVYLDEELEVDTVLIGTVQAVAHLLAGLAALATPLIAGRWGHVRTITWGSVGAILCLVPLVLSTDWRLAGLGFMALSALGTIRYAAMSVYQQEMVKARWRSQMSVAVSMAGGLSFSSVPLAGGFLIAAGGYQSFFLMSSVLSVVGILTFWLYFRTPRGEYRGAAERVC